MAVLSTSAVAATVSALITRTRRYLGDGSTTVGNQRWSDTDIKDALDGMIAHMYNELASQGAGGFWRTVTLSYTADADNVALPAGTEAQRIYKVEDYDDPTDPIYLDYRDSIDADRFTDQFGWHLIGNTIAIRPKPTAAKTLRITTLANFVPVSTAATPSTDQHNISVNHEELIVLGAVMRLANVDEGTSSTRMALYETLWEQYQKTCSRIAGPVYVRSSRIIQG
jgi:hypothetical protein